MKLRYIPCALILTFGIAGCANTQSGSTVANTVPPAQSVASIDTGSGAMATTCSISGFHWTYRVTTINPVMQVSKDGSCGRHFSLSTNVGALIQIQSNPQHGQITTSGVESSRPGFLYTPQKGYVGPDAFTLSLGSVRHLVTANVTVTVTG